MRLRLVGLLTASLVVVAACNAGSAGVQATRSRQVVTVDTSVPSSTEPAASTSAPVDASGTSVPKSDYSVIDGVVNFGPDKPAQPYDGFLTHAFNDIESFWSTNFEPLYGRAWTPLKGGIYAMYPGRTDKVPGCGSAETTYRDVEGNAFYCSVGDFMAYDDSSLLPDLVKNLGKEAVAIVLAHEFGHAVQFRAGESDQPTILKEQQADCFAGAWTAHVTDARSGDISFTQRAVRDGLIAMIYFKDPVQLSGADDPNAHGTGFDRVGAFQDGFSGGPKRCTTFFTEQRQLVNIPFTADVNNGNLPMIDANPDATLGPQDIVTLLPGSLQVYWRQLMASNTIAFTPPKLVQFTADSPPPACPGTDTSAWKGAAGWCKADNTIYWDRTAGDAALADIGDMAVGYLYAVAYGDAVQSVLHSRRTGEKRALMNDCLTGTWARYISPPIPSTRADQLSLSAGDLDEAIIEAINQADPLTTTNVHGSAFEKVHAFRVGVLGGLTACNASF
jgi:predicted metalloprotease